ncbi:MAG: Sir2 family NAD-dependent protein deacetylase [Thermodesulfobacteriota bacterium]|nr:Sir2 family NAD-dependent protein deacetylase [Thermodesulfobacteriota bacterium]
MVPLTDVAEWIRESRKIVGFTGAGISTNSGIPDFRSPGGVWAKNKTIMFQDFVDNYEDRVTYWQQKAAIWPDMRDASPNNAHLFFAELDRAGNLMGLITQNIDGLHERSGVDMEKIVRLHGWMGEAVCLSCGAGISMDEACDRVRHEPAPVCDQCGGLLKPATISFGQRLRESDLNRAAALSAKCDLFIVVGSSLVVQPAAGFPEIAKKNKARLVIVNNAATPLDSLADAVIREDIGVAFERLMAS